MTTAPGSRAAAPAALSSATTAVADGSTAAVDSIASSAPQHPSGMQPPRTPVSSIAAAIPSSIDFPTTFYRPLNDFGASTLAGADGDNMSSSDLAVDVAESLLASISPPTSDSVNTMLHAQMFAQQRMASMHNQRQQHSHHSQHSQQSHQMAQMQQHPFFNPPPQQQQQAHGQQGPQQQQQMLDLIGTSMNRRARAETFSTFSSPLDAATMAQILADGPLSQHQQQLLQLQQHQQQQQQQQQQHNSRYRRTGSLSLPKHSISDAFGPSLFVSGWEPTAAPASAHAGVGHSMPPSMDTASSAKSVGPPSLPSASLGSAGLTPSVGSMAASLASANMSGLATPGMAGQDEFGTPDTSMLERTLDYLGLDDPIPSSDASDVMRHTQQQYEQQQQQQQHTFYNQQQQQQQQAPNMQSSPFIPRHRRGSSTSNSSHDGSRKNGHRARSVSVSFSNGGHGMSDGLSVAIPVPSSSPMTSARPPMATQGRPRSSTIAYLESANGLDPIDTLGFMTGHPRPRQPYQQGQGQGQQGQQGQQGHANPYFLLPGPTPTSTTAPMLSSDFNHSSELVWDELVRHPQLLVQQQGQPLAQPHVQPQPQPTPLSHNHNQSNRDNHSKHSQPHSQPHSQQKQQQQQQVASVTALAAGSAHATTGTTAPSAGSGTSPTSKDEAGAVDRSQSDSPGHEHQSPSRSLWVGNIDSSLGQGDLLSVFSAFGTIESIRMLPERECAFINYARLEDAVAGRQQMQGGRVGHCIVRIGYGKVDATHENPAMLPTKSLWIGNISPTTTPLELERVFSAYGAVESARVLSHKNCGFVNFVSLEDAITARNGLNGKDVGGSTVKIGYAKVPPPKTESAAASSSALGSTGASGASAGLTGSSGLLGHAASAPISPSALAMTLPSPSMHLDAVVPLALGTATAGFPYPTAASSPWNGPMQPGSGIGPSPTFSPARFAPSMTTAHTSPTILVEAAPRTPSAAMLPSVFADSLATPADSPNHVHGHHYHHHHHHQHHQQQHHQHQHQQQARGGMPYFPDDMYSMTIPPIPEPSPNRRVDQSRLREIRKKLEGHPPQRDIELIFHEIIEDSPELCADYIGNVVIQKIVERCNDQNRQVLIEKVAPYLAALGIHKNGTWAVQKIIDCARTPGQAQAVIQGIRPYTPPLLLDQFGNYVVQCCLRLGINHNQFIFDAMAAKCWELGQGRFGARAMRACLESQYTVKRQQKQVSIAIVQHAPQLAMNPNGAILVTWLMDMSTLPGRYRVLAPAMLPHLTSLCTHKLASTCVLKLVNQRFELDARDAVLNELFNNPANLAHVLSDPVHGVAVVQKILASGCASTDERMRLADATRRVLLRIHDSPDSQPGYKRLMEELSVIPSGQHSTQMSGAALDGARIDDVVSPLTPHAPFFSTSQSTPGSGSGPAAATATGGANPSPMRQPSAPLFMDEPVATASSALYAGGAPSATSAGYGHYVGGQDHIPTPSQSPPPQLLQSAMLQSALSSAASSSHMQHVSFLGPPSNSGMYAHAMQQMHVHQQHQYFQQQQQQQIHQAAMNVASMSFAQQAQFQQQQQQQQQHGVHQPPTQAPFMSPYARQPTQDQGGYFAPMLGLANTSAMGGSPLHAFPQAGQHPGNGAGVNSGSDNPVFRPSFNDGTAGY